MFDPTAEPDTTELDPADWRVPVEDRVAAPASREPELLPFHERSWPDFERIILLFAEQVDGLRGVRLYGTPGQAQHGIDLYGQDAAGKNVAYQPKRLASFVEDDLDAAVRRFTAGRRPVNATSLVICVACETDRTQMSEALEAHRVAHPDIRIDLHDRRSLSEAMRSRPDLVSRLFGEEWADAFCRGAGWKVPQPATSDVLADALVRGPLAALGLEADVARADATADTDPMSAAQTLGAVVTSLINEGFDGFTTPLRRRRSELLIAAQAIDEAAAELSELAWQQADDGGADKEQWPASRLRDLTKAHALPEATALLAFTDQIEQWYGQPALTMDRLTSRAMELASLQHPLAAPAVLWVLETSVASREPLDPGLVNLLDGLLSGRAIRGLSDPINVRLRAVRADATDEWDNLLRDARAGRLGSPMSSLVHARFARVAASNSRAEDSITEYWLAVHRAASASLGREVASYVRSLVLVRMRFGYVDDGINELVRQVHDLEESGTVGHFKGRDALDAGALALANDKLPRALRWYRTALRRAVIRGDLADEEQARKGLVDVLVRSGEGAAALRHALDVGSVEDVEKCLPIGRYVDVQSRLAAGPHWERATAYRLTALQSDLMPDDEVDAHLGLALAATDEERRTFFAPQVDLNAWKVVAALVQRANPEAAADALDRLEPRIERSPNSYRHEDDEHITIVAGVAATQSSLQDRAIEHLGRIIHQGDHFGDEAGRAMVRAFASPPALLQQVLHELADDGSRCALATLGDFDLPHPALVKAVEADVEKVLSRPDPPPGTMEFGTALPRIARRARLLDEEGRIRVLEHCLALAEKTKRPQSNRSEGAEGVLLLADTIPSESRTPYFDRMIALVRSGDEMQDVDRPLMGGLHPLSTMRMNLGWGDLARDSLRAAAALATTDVQLTTVNGLALERLMSPERADQHAAVRTLALLDPDQVSIDLNLLVAHPEQFVRQLAAVVAVRREPVPVEVIRRLAGDVDPRVRRVIAEGTTTLMDRSQDVATSVSAELRTDPHWSVRRSLTST